MTRHATEFGAFQIDQMPGNPQIAICSGFFIFPKYRGMGYGHKLKAYQMEILKSAGYSLAICSVRSDNAPQLRVQARAQWDEMREFFNDQTGAMTKVFSKAIEREEV